MSKKTCRICPPVMDKEQAWEIWRLPAEDGARYASEVLGSVVKTREVEEHLEKHRAEQPPYIKKSKAECLRLVGALTPAEKKMLLLLYRFPALDLRSLSLLFYDRGDRELAWRVAGNSAYKMLREEILYRLYIKYLPGPGPRPKPGPGAIYFPGGASRAWVAEKTGKKISRKQWVSGRNDFKDWRAAWEQWKKGQTLASLLSISSPDEMGVRSLGPFTIRSENIWSGQILNKKVIDPLSGTFRLNPDCIVGVDYELFSIPLVMWSDNSSRKTEVVTRDAYRSAGLYRSGTLHGLREHFLLPTTLIWTTEPGRVEKLQRAAGKWKRGAGRVLAADQNTALARPEDPVWKDLGSGEALSLTEALQRNLSQNATQG